MAGKVPFPYVDKATDWAASSLHLYIDMMGRDEMVRLWNDYAVGNYGQGWDW